VVRVAPVDWQSVPTPSFAVFIFNCSFSSHFFCNLQIVSKVSFNFLLF
jgi:hypothetical protein